MTDVPLDPRDATPLGIVLTAGTREVPLTWDDLASQDRTRAAIREHLDHEMRALTADQFAGVHAAGFSDLAVAPGPLTT